jgi:inhibitor of KinA sporulation pathway (predicted exonuclease)
MSERLEYICVLDFEATTDGPLGPDGEIMKDKTRGPPYPHEVTEFPSVLLQWDSEAVMYKEISRFDQFCRPLMNPTITPFCYKLTGITQEQIDQGRDFPEVLIDHFRWLVKHINSEWSKLGILTGGFWDFGIMLPMECKKWALVPPAPYLELINIKKHFVEFYPTLTGGKEKGMAGMLKATGLPLVGKHHSGIDDCANIAQLVIKMSNDGFVFTADHKRKIPGSTYDVNRKKKECLSWALARCNREYGTNHHMPNNTKCSCGKPGIEFDLVDFSLSTSSEKKKILQPLCENCSTRQTY